MSQRERAFRRILLVAMFIGLVSAVRGQDIKEYQILGAGSTPVQAGSIISGWDAALWFTMTATGNIGRVTTTGSFSQVFLPTPNRLPGEIVTGLDGNFWVYLGSDNSIARVTSAGEVTEFPFPASGQNDGGLTVGPNGLIWVALNFENKVGYMTPNGNFTLFNVPTPNSGVSQIIAWGGAVWGTETNASKVFRVTTDGTFSEFPTQMPNAQPFGIAPSPDNAAVWFAMRAAHKIGKIPMSGPMVEYSIEDPQAEPWKIVAGPDDKLYFTDPGTNAIGEVTLDGVITETPTPTAGSGPEGIAVGPDNNIWFTESAVNQIGVFNVGANFRPCVPSPTVLCIDDKPGDKRFKITVTYQTSQGGGQAGDGKAIPLASLGVFQGGLFWFSSPQNPEILVKVLDACSISDRFWFFGSAGTNVSTDMSVIDTVLGLSYEYRSPDLHAFVPIQDTGRLFCRAFP